jgi:hypothetical protein
VNARGLRGDGNAKCAAQGLIRCEETGGGGARTWWTGSTYANSTWAYMVKAFAVARTSGSRTVTGAWQPAEPQQHAPQHAPPHNETAEANSVASQAIAPVKTRPRAHLQKHKQHRQHQRPNAQHPTHSAQRPVPCARPCPTRRRQWQRKKPVTWDRSGERERAHLRPQGLPPVTPRWRAWAAHPCRRCWWPRPPSSARRALGGGARDRGAGGRARETKTTWAVSLPATGRGGGQPDRAVHPPPHQRHRTLLTWRLALCLGVPAFRRRDSGVLRRGDGDLYTLRVQSQTPPPDRDTRTRACSRACHASPEGACQTPLRHTGGRARPRQGRSGEATHTAVGVNTSAHTKTNTHLGAETVHGLDSLVGGLGVGKYHHCGA